MRKNSPRKWLHAVLDLLPVILIPVFMIYSHRHAINDGSITIKEDKVLDFNQLGSPFVNTQYGLNVTFNDESGQFSIDGNGANNGPYIFKYPDQNDRRIGWYLVSGHKYYVRSNLTYNDGLRIQCYVNNNYYSPLINTIFGYDFTTTSFANVWFYAPNNSVVDVENLYVNVFDLSQMYGIGNEPSITEFDNLFDGLYYPYVLHDDILIRDFVTNTFNDTDIMSQFTYQLYNAVDKYFNMGNVFNLNGVYDWFNLNIFHGSAPIYIYVVWQIVLYEFVMDLLFLLYGLFMWFIDMVQHLMDKPFKSIK